MVTLLHAAQLSNYCGLSGHMTLLIILMLWQWAWLLVPNTFGDKTEVRSLSCALVLVVHNDKYLEITLLHVKIVQLEMNQLQCHCLWIWNSLNKSFNNNQKHSCPSIGIQQQLIEHTCTKLLATIAKVDYFNVLAKAYGNTFRHMEVVSAMFFI